MRFRLQTRLLYFRVEAQFNSKILDQQDMVTKFSLQQPA